MKHSELIANIAKKTGKTPKHKELAEILCKPIGTINSRASRDLKYEYDEIQRIKHYYGIDFDKDEYINNLVDDYMKEAKKKALNQKDFIEVDYYPEVFGSCGNGTFVPAEYKEKWSISKKLYNLSPSKKYSIINAFGDSMLPYIHDKDKLIVEHWNGEQIQDNSIYIFRFKDRIFCKRLVDNLTHIVVKSDNPMYEPIKIDYKESENDFQVIGKVIAMMRDMF